MKRILLFLTIMLWFTPTQAQKKDALPKGTVAERSVAASPSVESFRPVGDSRGWWFFSRQTTFGDFTSIVTGRKDAGELSGLVLKELLQVDFKKIGQENRQYVSGESYVSQRGFFAGCDYQIGPPDTSEQLSLTSEPTRLTGFYTNLGARADVDLPWKAAPFFWDAFMVDQLEIYLAMHDLKIGAILDDSALCPQSLVFSHIRGQVTSFMWQEIYKGKLDSVFVIQLTEPGRCQLFFTPDKRLVKVDFQDMDIRVYQNAVRQVSQSASAEANKANPSTSRSTEFSVRALILKLPHYVAFLVITGVMLLLFAAKAFKWRDSYLALGSGIVVYLVMPLVVYPLLLVLARDWLGMGSATASGFYVRGAVFSFVSGLIPAALILAAIMSLQRMTKLPSYKIAGIGAFVGAGFALAEAAYVSGMEITILFSRPLLERAGFIALGVATGALIGRLLKENMVFTVWGVLGSSVRHRCGEVLPNAGAGATG